MAIPFPEEHTSVGLGHVGDVDGDGQTDWIHEAYTIEGDPPRLTKIFITSVVAAKKPPKYVESRLMWTAPGTIVRSYAADVNGDGRTDIVSVTGRDIPGAKPGSVALGLVVALRGWRRKI